MDVCQPQAIAMRIDKSDHIEGNLLSYLELSSDGNDELPLGEMMTFPYLAAPQHCDGCKECVEECPVLALELQDDQYLVEA